MEFTNNPITGNAATSPMPNASSWTHVPTSPAARRTETSTDATRVLVAAGYTGRTVAAFTKQGAPPRGEPR